MKNLSHEWIFFPRRGKLSEKDVSYWRLSLERLMKAGVELEYNLPEKSGSCNRDNFMCGCTAVFVPKILNPGTAKCFEQCGNWDKSVNEKGLPLYPANDN